MSEGPFKITESVAEEATLQWLDDLDYVVLSGPDIAHDGPTPERTSYSEVVLPERLRHALGHLNPEIPDAALEEAMKKVLRTESPSVVENNRHFHRYLADGVPVEYQADGRTVHDHAKLIDFEDPGKNDIVAVNQLTVVEAGHNRRPDVVIFLNGLPVAVFELKNPASETATVKHAFNQIQTYKKEIPSLFVYNALVVVSDGLEARMGTITSNWERFMPWRTVDGDEVAPLSQPQLDVLLKGVFVPERLLDLIRHYLVFDDDGSTVVKKLAAYHQYHAVSKAVDCTVRAAAPSGDRRVGVVWHTQGSGKSLSMAFYAGKIIQHPAMENPTLVVITDRNDLDDQLFGTFATCKDLIRQTPEQADSRDDLKALLSRASGGVIFTTIQKFLPETRGEKFPELSDRRNIVVIADEAHRSQYGFRGLLDRKSGQVTYGFAQHLRDALPNASFIGFTGTPIESDDKDTRKVFGDYIDVYDIQRAVEDGATVRIYYEGRLAKIELKEDEKPKLDPELEEVTEGEEQEDKEKLKTRWARLEALVGTEKRLGLVAQDIVDHFEKRQKALTADGYPDGKAMIVAMSRRICVDLYDALVKLRPEWSSDDDTKGVLKVVMTGSASDRPAFQTHIRSKKAREALAKRFKDPDDEFRVVIVRDMWLTGFDAPCLHTMYMDKPMGGHNLMQAIARVNRVFREKDGGLVVDYLGLADQLKKALRDYTESGGKGAPTFDQAEAVAVMLEKHEVVVAMFDGFDCKKVVTGSPGDRIKGLTAAMDHVLGLDDGKKRYLKAVASLSKAFALCASHEEALKIRDDVAFFQAVRAAIVKMAGSGLGGGGPKGEELDAAIRQLVSKAVSSDEVIDVFQTAGLERPDISILSDEFLEEVRHLPHRNVAVELLQKLLNDDIKVRSRRNVVQARSFSEMLEAAILKYQNRTIEAAQVIAELIELAKDMRKAHERGEKLGLNDEELAFYDALGVNDSAVQVLGDDTLRTIACELVQAVRKNATIDWTVKESVRAKLRVLVRRVLRKYGYPPDKQEQATRTVLEQAERIAEGWAA